MRTLRHIPGYARKSEVIKTTLAVADTELAALEVAADDALLQLFAESASSELSRWEEYLAIDDWTGMEDTRRRRRVLAKLRGLGTTTRERLRILAEAYCDQADVVEDAARHRVKVRFLAPTGQPAEVADWHKQAAEIYPAHLVRVTEFRQEPDNGLFVGGAARFGSLWSLGHSWPEYGGDSGCFVGHGVRLNTDLGLRHVWTPLALSGGRMGHMVRRCQSLGVRHVWALTPKMAPLIAGPLAKIYRIYRLGG